MLYILLFQSTPCKHPVIVLQDVAWTDLHALVEFIYHGEVNVHQRSLSSFLKTAEVLRVSGLTQQHGDDRESVMTFPVCLKRFITRSGYHKYILILFAFFFPFNSERTKLVLKLFLVIG